MDIALYPESFKLLLHAFDKISNCIDGYILFIKYPGYKVKVKYHDRDLYTVSTSSNEMLIEKKLYSLNRFLKQMTTKPIESIKIKNTVTSIKIYP